MYKSARCKGCNKCTTICEHAECQPYNRCIRVCGEDCLEITGRWTEAKELAKELMMSAEILGKDFGGFTFSGGEPLAQPDFLLELMQELKDYHLCIETSGFAKTSVFKSVLDKLDYVIMDIKIANAQEHRKFTGVDNFQILENFAYLKQYGKPYIVRTPMIPNITDTKENLEAIQKIIGESCWEKIPYNSMAGAKYKMLGIEYEL